MGEWKPRPGHYKPAGARLIWLQDKPEKLKEEPERFSKSEIPIVLNPASMKTTSVSNDGVNADTYLQNPNWTDTQKDSAYNSANPNSVQNQQNILASGLKDIVKASREKNFTSPYIQETPKTFQNGNLINLTRARKADPVTQAVAGAIAQPLQEGAQAVEDFGKGNYGQGTVGVLSSLLHTSMLPFTAPYAGVESALKRTGDVGGQVAEGLNRTMNLPFDAVKIGQKGTQKALEAIGVKPAELEKAIGVNPELSKKITNLMTELGGLYLMSKGHKGIKEYNEKKVPVAKMFKDRFNEVKPLDRQNLEQGLNEVAPTETAVNISQLPKQEISNAIKEGKIEKSNQPEYQQADARGQTTGSGGRNFNEQGGEVNNLSENVKIAEEKKLSPVIQRGIENRVKKLGNLDEVNNFYTKDDAMSNYAKSYAQKIYGEEKPIDKPFYNKEQTGVTQQDFENANLIDQLKSAVNIENAPSQTPISKSEQLKINSRTKRYQGIIDKLQKNESLNKFEQKVIDDFKSYNEIKKQADLLNLEESPKIQENLGIEKINAQKPENIEQSVQEVPKIENIEQKPLETQPINNAKSVVELTNDELQNEFDNYSKKISELEKYYKESNTNTVLSPEQMLGEKDFVRFDEVRNEYAKREQEIAKQKIAENRKQRVADNNLSAIQNLTERGRSPEEISKALNVPIEEVKSSLESSSKVNESSTSEGKNKPNQDIPIKSVEENQGKTLTDQSQVIQTKLATGFDNVLQLPLAEDAQKMSLEDFKKENGFYFEGDTSRNYYKGTAEEFYNDVQKAQNELNQSQGRQPESTLKENQNITPSPGSIIKPTGEPKGNPVFKPLETESVKQPYEIRKEDLEFIKTRQAFSKLTKKEQSFIVDKLKDKNEIIGFSPEEKAVFNKIDNKINNRKPLGKEFYEMTYSQFVSEMGGAGRHSDLNLAETHKGNVIKALKEDKQVPENVLADYPDLAEKYSAKTGSEISPIIDKSKQIDTKVTEHTYTDRWDSAKLGTRVELVKRAKWITNSGKLSRTGERIAETKWDDLPDSAKEVLKRELQKDYANIIDEPKPQTSLQKMLEKRKQTEESISVVSELDKKFEQVEKKIEGVKHENYKQADKWKKEKNPTQFKLDNLTKEYQSKLDDKGKISLKDSQEFINKAIDQTVKDLYLYQVEVNGFNRPMEDMVGFVKDNNSMDFSFNEDGYRREAQKGMNFVYDVPGDGIFKLENPSLRTLLNLQKEVNKLTRKPSSDFSNPLPKLDVERGQYRTKEDFTSAEDAKQKITDDLAIAKENLATAKATNNKALTEGFEQTVKRLEKSLTQIPQDKEWWDKHNKEISEQKIKSEIEKDFEKVTTDKDGENKRDKYGYITYKKNGLTYKSKDSREMLRDVIDDDKLIREMNAKVSSNEDMNALRIADKLKKEELTADEKIAELNKDLQEAKQRKSNFEKVDGTPKRLNKSDSRSYNYAINSIADYQNKLADLRENKDKINEYLGVIKETPESLTKGESKVKEPKFAQGDKVIVQTRFGKTQGEFLKDLGNNKSEIKLKNKTFSFKNENVSPYDETLLQKKVAPKTDIAKSPTIEKILVKKQVDKLRTIAKGMDSQIDSKMNSGISKQNPTARRARIAASMERDGERLQEIQQALNTIADHIENGTLPESLKKVSSRADVETIRTLPGTEPNVYVHMSDVNTLLEIANRKPGIKEIKEKLTYLRDGYTTNSKTIEGLNELYSLAKKYSTSDPLSSYSRFRKNLTDYNRIKKLGIETREDAIKIKEDYKNLIENKLPKESEQAQKIKQVERELIGNKIPGYFDTRGEALNKIIDLANIQKGMDVLEPSAGKGNIADKIVEQGVKPDVAEINYTLRDLLKLKEHNLVADDFLKYGGKKYDRIVMNPPFENLQDIDHVKHAYELLKPGGKLVSVMGEGGFFRSDKKATDFREWLDGVNGHEEKLPEKSFTGVGGTRNTGVNARVVVIDKPESRIISEDIYKQAKHNVVVKGLGVNPSFIDPSLIKDYAIIGGYHLENLARLGVKKGTEFAEWSKEMISDFGEEIKDHLKLIWDNIENKEEFLPKEEKTTGIKNAVVNAERELLKQTPIEKEASRGREQVWEEAKAKIASGEVNPRDFVTSLEKKPRAVSDLEDSYIAHDRVSLTNERETVSDLLLRAVKEGDEQGKVDAELRLERVNKDIAQNDLVSDRVGTKTAQGLAFRRWLYKNDYSLASIERQLNVINQGKPLSKDVRAELETLVKEHEERNKILEEKLKQSEERISKLEAEKIVKHIQRQIGFENRRAKRQRTHLELTAERKNLYNDLLKTTVKDYNIGSAFGGLNTDAVKILGQIAKNYVETGINTAEGLVDIIYNDLKDKLEGVTQRDIRDAITGYGRQTKGKSIDEINAQLKDIKQELTLISKIEDAQSGKRPFRARFDKSQPKENVAKLRNQLNKIIKEKGLKEPISDEAKLRAYRKRIETKQSELEERIKTGNYTEPEKKPLELDPETIEAKTKLLETQKKLQRLIDMQKYYNRSGGQKLKDWITEIVNLPRSAYMTVADFSAPLRQGLLLTARRPIMSATKVLPEAVKAMFDPKVYDAIEAKIALSPNKKYYDRFGVEITEAHGEPFNLGKREEIYMSTLAEHMPVFENLKNHTIQNILNIPSKIYNATWAEVVKASERGFTAYMNLLRTSSFDKIIDFERRNKFSPDDPKNQKLFSDLAEFVNVASLRGNFGKINKAAPLLNGIVFSVRNNLSRLQLMNPVYYYKMEKRARVEAWKTLASTVGAGMTILSLAKLAGLDVETNPLSSDAGKIKVGNTRLDMWGGNQQFVRYLTQFALNKTKSVTGTVRDLDAKKYPFASRATITWKFVENKLSPQASLLWGWMKQRNNIGQDFEIGDEVIQRMLPLAISDSYQAIDELGWLQGGSMAIPGMFGAGLQSYKPKNPAASLEGDIENIKGKIKENGITKELQDELDKKYNELIKVKNTPEYEQFLKGKAEEKEKKFRDRFKK